MKSEVQVNKSWLILVSVVMSIALVCTYVAGTLWSRTNMVPQSKLVFQRIQPCNDSVLQGNRQKERIQQPNLKQDYRVVNFQGQPFVLGGAIDTSTANTSEPHYRLTQCAIAKNELPYLVEWIEWMALQGVNQFIIYDNNSKDNTSLLGKFYSQFAPERNVTVLPTKVTMLGGNYDIGWGIQWVSYQHCLLAYGQQTDWMIFSDIDEYFYSYKYGTIGSVIDHMQEIEAQYNKIFTEIYCDAQRFGTAGQIDRLPYRITEAGNGTVVFGTPKGKLDVLLDHKFRGPDDRLESERAKYKQMHAAVEGCNKEGVWDVCSHGPGKTIVRPDTVLVAGVHYPDGRNSREADHLVDPEVCFMRHFYVRSKADAELKTQQDGKEDPWRMYDTTDQQFWNEVLDNKLNKLWRGKLVAQLKKLVTLRMDPAL